jgi:hypothetical protein
MLARFLWIFGSVVIVLTLVLWWLLSGFGCGMNTAGCGSVRLDLSPDALRLFLPGLGVGAVFIAAGIWSRR